MSRLTAARLARWQRDLDKAEALVERVLADQRSAYNAAKGGRLSDLGRCLEMSKDASVGISAARGTVRVLDDNEQRRRSPRQG